MNPIPEQISWYVAIFTLAAAIAAPVHWFTKSHYMRLLSNLEKQNAANMLEVSRRDQALAGLTVQIDAMHQCRVATAEAFKSLHILLQASGQVLNTDSASVLIPDPIGSTSLVFLAAIGPARNRILSLRISTKSQAGKPFTTKSPTLWNYADSEILDGSADERSGFRTRSLISIPIFENNTDIIGVVQYVSSEMNHFAISDVERIKPILKEIGSLVIDISNDPGLKKIINIQQVGEEADCIVLFSDISNFGTIFDAVASPEVISFLNDVFGRLSDIIRANGGKIGGYPGDGLFCCFNDTNGIVQLVAALKSARAIQYEFMQITEEWSKLGIHTSQFDLRVGLARGKCCSCMLGHPSESIQTFIGPAVNQAFEMCEYARLIDSKLAASTDIINLFNDLAPETAYTRIPRGSGEFFSIDD